MADMNNLPVNNYASKTKQQDPPPTAITKGKKADESLQVNESKPSLGKRLLKQFIQMKPKDVGESVLENVLVPGLKQVASSVFDGAKNLFLFGDDTITTPQTGPDGKIAYNKVGQGAPVITARDKAAYNFKNIYIPTKQEAVNTLAGLQQQLASFDEVTVNYFYLLTGVDTDWNGNSYGWKDLSAVTVRQTPNGFILTLPPVIKLSENNL